MSVLRLIGLTLRLLSGRERRGSRPALIALIFGLMGSLGYAYQQSDQALGRKNQVAEQAATPKTLPTSTPSPDAPNENATPETIAAPAEISSSDSALRTRIQDAFNKDPMFSQGSLKVTILPEGIELSGDVANGRDRQNAERLAQSYARGKKVLNHIVVRGHSALPGSNLPQNSPGKFNSTAGTSGSARNTPQ